MRYATRLNSLRSRPELWFEDGQTGTLEVLRRAATIDGLDALSLNYPEHFHDITPRDVQAHLGGSGSAWTASTSASPRSSSAGAASRTRRPAAGRRRSR